MAVLPKKIILVSFGPVAEPSDNLANMRVFVDGQACALLSLDTIQCTILNAGKSTRVNYAGLSLPRYPFRLDPCCGVSVVRSASLRF